MYYSISGEFLRKMYHLLLAQVFYYDTRQLPNCYYSGLSNFNSKLYSLFFLNLKWFLIPTLGSYTSLYKLFTEIVINSVFYLTNEYVPLTLRSWLCLQRRKRDRAFFLQRNQNRLEKMVPSLFSIYLHFKAINQGLFPIQVLNLFLSLFLLS